MDSFFEKLASSSFGSQSSDHLKLLSKRAAGLYTRGEVDSLNDAVRSVVDTEDLNQEQVRRVAEMANQATWDESFHRGGQTDTTFEPADADAVLGELEEKPQVVSDDQSSLDYYNDVPNQTQDVDWKEVFKADNDTPEYEALNPTGPEQAAVEKTASARDVARFGVDQVLPDLVTTGEELYQMVKQAHLRDGHGLVQISQAVGQAIEDPGFALAIMKQASDRLRSEGVVIDEKDELMKLAYPLVINTEHPLLQKAANLEKLAKAYYSADAAHEELRKEHRKVHTVLRDKLRGL